MVLTLGIATMPAFVQAQESAVGFAFTGPIWDGVDWRQAWTVGGGGEMVTGWKGTTIGLDAAGLWFHGFETDGRFRHPITARVVSLDMSRHFHPSSSFGRWQPFLTGGVLIVASGDVGQGGFTIGAGVDRWFTRHAGMRIDVRDQFLPGSFSLVGVRAGVVFR
jgi:hypothetical protein